MLSLIFSVLQKMIFLALHIVNPSTFPKPLSSKEETECFKKIKSGDKSAKDKLINHNLRLVAHIIKKFNFLQENNEDLISIGTIGLIKAVNTFKPEKKIRFSSYASRCIENEILMNLRSSKKNNLDISMSEPIESAKSENSLTLMDTIADKVSLYEKIFDKIDIEKLNLNIKKYLTQREQDVINLRYGLINNNPHTQQEVASKIGISRSYVSRIEKKALNILKTHLN
ncbi:MAG: RNA polymerase sporulation sigma factor SigK [Clostridia bacterium]|nr:RNA polymerase sporulation sigma factor SigK [Clostridia bacterium]